MSCSTYSANLQSNPLNLLQILFCIDLGGAEIRMSDIDLGSLGSMKSAYFCGDGVLELVPYCGDQYQFPLLSFMPEHPIEARARLPATA